mgnify:FL=1
MLIDDPVDTDGIVSVVNTVIMPSLTKPNDEPGIMVHIDDCLCEDCTLERGEILFASTVLIEITNDKHTMLARLLPNGALAMARELFKHTSDLEELRERGVFGDEQ